MFYQSMTNSSLCKCGVEVFTFVIIILDVCLRTTVDIDVRSLAIDGPKYFATDLEVNKSSKISHALSFKFA